jgi:hypothetical protein
MEQIETELSLTLIQGTSETQMKRSKQSNFRLIEAWTND